MGMVTTLHRSICGVAIAARRLSLSGEYPEYWGCGEGSPRAISPFQPAHWIHYSQFGKTESQNALAREAWSQEVFTRFREFAMFPVLDKIEPHGSGVCVRFLDLRFTVPSLPPSLGFGVCRDSSTGPWRLRQKDGAFGVD